MASVLDADDGAGFLRGIDPRFRIVAVVVFAVVVVECRTLLAPALGLTLAMVLLGLSRLPVGATLRRMAGMDAFIVFMLLMLPFTVPGDVLFAVAGFPASRQGLMQAAQIALKANAVVLTLMTLVGSMSSVTLGHALRQLHFPEKLVQLLMFTVRYIDVLHAEYLRLRTAMKARGFRPSTSLHTLRSLGYLVGMMLVRAMERSERILAAMKCRGFTGQFPQFARFRIEARDRAFGVIAFLSCVLLIAVELLDVSAH